jgi:hypothetical protein
MMDRNADPSGSPAALNCVIDIIHLDLYTIVHYFVCRYGVPMTQILTDSFQELHPYFINALLAFKGVTESMLDPKRIQGIMDKRLDDREYQIICLRFGIDQDLHTLKQVGEIFDITKEWVRKIQNRGLKKIADELVYLCT